MFCVFVVSFKGSSPSSAPELMSSRSTRPPNATGCQPANTPSLCPSSMMPAATSTASSAWAGLRWEPTTHMTTHLHMHANSTSYVHITHKHGIYQCKAMIWTLSWIFLIIGVQARGCGCCFRGQKAMKGHKRLVFVKGSASLVQMLLQAFVSRSHRTYKYCYLVTVSGQDTKTSNSTWIL